MQKTLSRVHEDSILWSGDSDLGVLDLIAIKSGYFGSPVRGNIAIAVVGTTIVNLFIAKSGEVCWWKSFGSSVAMAGKDVDTHDGLSGGGGACQRGKDLELHVVSMLAFATMQSGLYTAKVSRNDAERKGEEHSILDRGEIQTLDLVLIASPT